MYAFSQLIFGGKCMESKKENDIQFSHKSLINDVKNIINNGKNNA